MPNEDQINLEACLCALEKAQNYFELLSLSVYEDYSNLLSNTLQSLKTLLSNKVEVSPADAERVLKICLRCTTDAKFVLYVFSIISELIDIDKDNRLVNFLPFALALLEFLNTKCLVADNAIELRIRSLQVLMKHPKSTLIELISHHSPKIIETLQLILGTKAEELPSILQTFKLLSMLEWLPPREKRLFVETGVPLWLAGVIPMMMQIAVSAEDVNDIEACLTYTELLAEELMLLNYFRHPQRLTLLEQITNREKFPKQIMHLLDKGKDTWHRIIIVLIKIVQNQLTEHCPCLMASPLSAMLPILEAALKREPAQIVRALACWNELIEILCHEDGMEMKKKIELLIEPLKSVNAKTEETVVAKFGTWWHFIQKFKLKGHNFNEILISFLHFMFGSTTEPFLAIEVSDCMRKNCIDAFVELMQIDCSNRAITNLKRFDDNITTTILLPDHWNDFVRALKSCLRAVAQIYTNDTKKKIQCLWISFLRRLATIGEDTLRLNMFGNLIDVLSELKLVEVSRHRNEHIMEILVDDMILTLFRDNKLKTITKSRTESCRLTREFVKFIMEDVFNIYYDRFNSKELTKLLDPLITTLLEEFISTPQLIIWLLDDLKVTRNTLAMWTALAQASKKANLSLEIFDRILQWPFQTVFCSDLEVKEAAKAWSALYDRVKNLGPNFGSKVARRGPVKFSKAYNYLVLSAVIGVYKDKPDKQKLAKLEALTHVMNEYKDYNELLIPLVNTIELTLNSSTDKNLAQISINCVKNIFKVIYSGLSVETKAIGSKNQNREDTISNIRTVLDTITLTFKNYSEKCPYHDIKKQIESILTKHDKTESPREKTQKNKMLRLEKLLAIDMVDGHPFFKTQSAKRRTRETLMDVENGEKSKTPTDELNKKRKLRPKAKHLYKPKSPAPAAAMLSPALHGSEDDICVKAENLTPEAVPIVVLEKITVPFDEQYSPECFTENTENDRTVEQNPSTEENYLELQTSLPTVTSSPSGLILKRELVEIIDDSTEPPAKRNCVSFHNSPVSNIRIIDVKSLANTFLASALSENVESFTEATTPRDETENI